MAGPSARSPRGAPSLLPDIRHPALLLGDPGTLSVRGLSRAAGKEDLSASSRGSGRRTAPRDNLRNYGGDHLDSWRNLDRWANIDRTFSERHTNEKKEDSSASPSTRLETEKLRFRLLEKINGGGFYDLKRQFLSHDPECRGRVTRDALLVILTTFLGRFISRIQFQHLLSRLRLDEKPIVTFDSFYDHFKLEENTNPPDWLDPMKRKQKAAVKTAHEVHLELRDMANNRYFELLKLFPKDSLTSSEFHSALSKLGVRMTEEEFKRLWHRYIREDNGILKIEDLRCHLGAKAAQELYEDRSLLLSGLQKVSRSREDQKMSTRVGSRTRNERKLSLSIEKWLKERFREGARAMMAEFLVCDPERTHKVSRDDFLQVLERFQLHLTGDQLGHFLARCGLDENSSDVDYVDFLQRIQTRRKSGRAHKILSKQENRAADRRSVSSASTTGTLEGKLLNYLHAEFSALLEEFRKADTNKVNVISQQDFRGILERRFCIKVTDEEFAHLLERIPADHQGAIRYRDFMAKFDSGDENLSLWGGNKTILTDCSQKPKAISKVGNSAKKEKRQGRSAEQLTGIIKNLVKNNYESLERNFNEMDPMNTRRMTAESLYQLLKRCDIHPEISREEVGKVWKTLIQNQDQTVDYFQFVRHFGFSVKSSCFPNAKISPPVRGDGDCLIRSLKLNSDTKIIANFLQTKVKLLLPDLWRQFRESDPQNSGCVTKEEFLDTVQELSPDLTDHQCDTLAAKFGHGPNKISYVKFLQPYQTGTPPIKHNGGRAATAEAKVTPPQWPMDPGLNVITSKLRQKLSSGDWRNLLHTCQKLDTDGSGFLLLPEFRSVVKLCNMVLDEDDIYAFMSHYDRDLAGKIDYSRLVSDQKRK
ncbi:PREDICTED: EF-hand calcium-binding domain-containing protein 6-like [Nanorana parkeri]|uniref:EF-hand calcium-binding domain-containing protein 6-like n=1 Tax=Nanorana parkeri TaxID=125878 RepID=UPI00085500DB|nr:PREDICTED: EF-hand calcium-binding domain-containing protein 6-like [Nanorana parkeri]